MKRSSVIGIVFVCFFSILAHAQEELKVANSAVYQTDLDKQLTIKTISVLPVSDNAGGIYARPVEEEIKDLVNKDARFQYVNSEYAGALVSLDDLEANPQQVKDITQNIKADALIGCRVIKGPDGMTTHLSLFLKADGKLISQQFFKDKPTADIKSVRNTTDDLYAKMIKQIPYDGLVLSRSGSMVTINLGKKNGLSPGQTVTAVLILKAVRHPKFHFIISTDKEVLGKIKLQKVDDAISFGQIITEKDSGSIQKNAKISGIDFVQYNEVPFDGTGAGYTPQNQDKNLQKQITFGDNPKEWKPSNPPSFGKVGAQLGLGQMRYNTTLNSAGSIGGSDSLYPIVKLYTELWFTPQWIFDFELDQGILNFSNPLAGSPSKINVNQSTYLFSMGYNFMIQDDFFGPSILVALGFADYELNVDSSTPLSLTATHYTGIFLNVRGTLPVSEDKKWNMGASLKYFLKSNLSESPQDSGGNSNTITQFSLIGYYQKNTHLRYTGSLDFSLFSTNFDGGGSRADNASNASQKYTTLSGGIEYLF